MCGTSTLRTSIGLKFSHTFIGMDQGSSGIPFSGPSIGCPNKDIYIYSVLLFLSYFYNLLWYLMTIMMYLYATNIYMGNFGVGILSGGMCLILVCNSGAFSN